MRRFSGLVGYGETEESPPGSGIWKDVITEKSYFGDVIRNTRRSQEGEHLNNDITVQNSISIVADAYAHEHFFNIKYVKWQGVAWQVPEVTVDAPRLVLRLGGVYNGPFPVDDSDEEAGTPDSPEGEAGV